MNDLGVDGFEHLVDTDGSFWSAFDVTSQPSFAFIDDDGTIEVRRGRMGEASLTERIEDLISR